VTTDPAGPVDRVDLVTTDPAGPATTVVLEPGTAMTTAATSTVPRGETDPHPGVQASHHGRPGTGRFPRPVDGGTRARSTTGATTKTQSGTKVSTSGASTSSEFGSRCKDSPHQTPASPIGEAGVAHLQVVAPIRPVTDCPQHGAAWATMRKSPKSCQSRALLWGNGDVALDAISARLDRCSGERGCARRRHAGGPHRNCVGLRARKHPPVRGARAVATHRPHSGRRGTGAPGTSQPGTACASPSPS
jgi:hypothetical protein